MSINDTKGINRREIFRSAHFAARLHHFNTGKRKPYAYWFAAALKHQYSKLRQEKERASISPAPMKPITRHRFLIGGNRQTLAIGA